MKHTLRQLVEDYYKNSPDWPLPMPTDMENETRDFMLDETPFSHEHVLQEIKRFWETEKGNACSTCNGAGEYEQTIGGDGYDNRCCGLADVTVTCSDCNGTGKANEEETTK